jgi:hypothetical protein
MDRPLASQRIEKLAAAFKRLYGEESSGTEILHTLIVFFAL